MTEALTGDRGCRLHSKCLQCPEKQCIYESPAARGQARRESNVNRFRVHKLRGKSPQEIAEIVGLSVRSVQRYLAE